MSVSIEMLIVELGVSVRPFQEIVIYVYHNHSVPEAFEFLHKALYSRLWAACSIETLTHLP